MSTLVQAVIQKFPSDALREDEITRILDKHQVTGTAFIPAPAHLHATRLRFSGIKTLTGVSADGDSTHPEVREQVPFDFDWVLTTGLHGVGSDRNLRGKSSVLRILMWALRGRCDLQPEVQSWIDRVALDFKVDEDTYCVAFEVDHDNHHYPRGVLTRSRRGTTVTVGSFDRPDEFESVMGGTMMAALGLPAIAAQTEGTRTQHAWPTYAGALTIRGDNLDYLLGDVRFAGLPSRLLSMFVGTPWAAARAEATTAVTLVETRLRQLENDASQRTDELRKAHTKATEEVAQLRVVLESIKAPRTDPQQVLAALQAFPRLDAEVARLSKLLQGARNHHDEVQAQLADERSRRHQELEDAIASRFFQNLRPTSCPRCSEPVTPARLKAEAAGHSCSVCATDIDLVAHQNHIVLSSSVSNVDIKRLEAPSESLGKADPRGHNFPDDIDEVVDDLTALVDATGVAEKRMTSLEAQLVVAEQKRDETASVVAAHAEANEIQQARQQALIDLARAEGVASALTPDGELVESARADAELLRSELRVLKAAQTITTKWVHDDQAQRLTDLESSIVTLARSFGMANLTQVSLSGNTAMKVTKGGSTNAYGKTERGEKVRLKLATAIALIQQGRNEGVGRHPGLLIVDSPGAEEINQDDFDTMIEALNREAEAAEIQIFIGTRHTDELIDLLGESRCRIGRGNNFVW